MKGFLTTILLCSIFTTTFSQNPHRYSGEFLLITPDAKAASLGNSGCAGDPDGASGYWNAAKLAFSERPKGGIFSYVPWITALMPDVRYAYLSSYKKRTSDQIYGASARYLSFGDKTFYVGGTIVGQGIPREFAADLFYSRKLGENFSAAMSARYIYSDIFSGQRIGSSLSHAAAAFATDISVFGKEPFPKHSSLLTYGISISNIGNKLSYADSSVRVPLPANIRAGTGLRIGDHNTFGLNFDINRLITDGPPGLTIKEELQKITYNTGIELGFQQCIFIRSGIHYRLSEYGSYMSAGLGIRYSLLELNMAYYFHYKYPRTPFGNTVFFTLVYQRQKEPQDNYVK